MRSIIAPTTHARRRRSGRVGPPTGTCRNRRFVQFDTEILCVPSGVLQRKHMALDCPGQQDRIAEIAGQSLGCKPAVTCADTADCLASVGSDLSPVKNRADVAVHRRGVDRVLCEPSVRVQPAPRLRQTEYLMERAIRNRIRCDGISTGQIRREPDTRRIGWCRTPRGRRGPAARYPGDAATAHAHQ